MTGVRHGLSKNRGQIGGQSDAVGTSESPITKQRGSRSISHKSQNWVDRWALEFGVDMEQYKATAYTNHIDAISKKKKKKYVDDLRLRRDKVAFYYSHFQLGLRLPLDPFICEFMEVTNCSPVDLALNTIRILISFIVICRCLGFEPRMRVFSKFYTASMSHGHMCARAKKGAFKLLTPFPNKVSGWDDKIILVESKLGWPFVRPTGKPLKLSMEEEDDSILDEVLKNAILKKLETHNRLQRKVFVWEELTTDTRLLTLTGISRNKVDNILPRVTLRDDVLVAGWKFHMGYVFEDECGLCRQLNNSSPCETNGIMSAAQLREQKLLAERARRNSAGQRQIELSKLPAESLSMSTNVPKKRSELPPRRRRLIQQVYDVESDEEEENSGSKEMIPNEVKCTPESNTADFADVSSHKRKVAVGEGEAGPSTRLKVSHAKEPDAQVINLFQDSGLKSAVGEHRGKDVADSAEKKSTTTMDYDKLAKEIGDVPVLRNLDLHCTEGSGLQVGLSIMKRVVDFGYQEKLEDNVVEAFEVFGRMGLNVSEFTTGGSILVNKIVLPDDARKNLEKMLANANRLLEEKKEEAYKRTEQFSKAEQELLASRKELKEMQEKEASYVTRLEEVERVVATFEQEKREWKEDEAQWFNERHELLAKAADASAVAWSDFVDQYEKSGDFQKKIDERVLGCYEEGMYHALRMAAGSNLEGITPELLADWGSGLHYCEQARRGHAIVPYSKAEVDELRARDEKDKMPAFELAKPDDVNVKTLMGVVEEIWEEKDGEERTANE